MKEVIDIPSEGLRASGEQGAEQSEGRHSLFSLIYSIVTSLTSTELSNPGLRSWLHLISKKKISFLPLYEKPVFYWYPLSVIFTY